MKAEAADEEFDKGSDIFDMLDIARGRRSMEALKRVDVDGFAWMIVHWIRKQRRAGVTRQSIIKVWLAERLECLATRKALQRTGRCMQC